MVLSGTRDSKVRVIRDGVTDGAFASLNTSKMMSKRSQMVVKVIDD